MGRVRKAVFVLNRKKITVYQLCVTALMAALMCILGPVTIPIGAVPISLMVLVMLLSVYLLGWKLGTLSVLLYLAIGAVGLPVFSGYQGGLAKLAGPTGGYLLGYVPMAIIAGLFIEKSGAKILWSVLGMVLAVAVLYAFGTAWFVLQMQCTVGYALTVCVLPFLAFDAAKIAVALVAGGLLRRRLTQAGFLGARTAA